MQDQLSPNSARIKEQFLIREGNRKAFIQQSAKISENTVQKFVNNTNNRQKLL